MLDQQPTTTNALASAPRSTAIPLSGNQQLLVEHGAEGDVLRLAGPDGKTFQLAIHITADGPVLRFENSGLTIQAAGDLRIAAGRVAIHGADGMALTTGGDLTIEASGTCRNHATSQEISAELGNVNVHANDDVKLNGERIRMNC